MKIARKSKSPNKMMMKSNLTQKAPDGFNDDLDSMLKEFDSRVNKKTLKNL